MNISLQLYTIRDETKKDFAAACKAVADIGYRWVELAGTAGLSPADARTLLADLGLGISGAHFGEDALTETSRVIEENGLLGNSEVTIAWLPERYRDSEESCRKTGDLIGDAAVKFAEYGMTLGYHNHDAEFRMFGGKYGLQWLLFSELAYAQVDVYWAKKAGVEPVEAIRLFEGRIPSVHLKDYGEDTADIELGKGILHFSAITKECYAAGAQTLVVEMDNPRLQPLESARVSFDYLNGLLGSAIT